MTAIRESLALFARTSPPGRSTRAEKGASESGVKSLMESLRVLAGEQALIEQEDDYTHVDVVTDVPADALQKIIGIVDALEQSGDFEPEDLNALSGAVQAVLSGAVTDEELDDVMDALTDLVDELVELDMEQNAQELAAAVMQADDYFYSDEEDDEELELPDDSVDDYEDDSEDDYGDEDEE